MAHLLERVGLSPLAEDCAINPIDASYSLLTTIDIVTPIHDDPYVMGQIAAVNVTNDIFVKNSPNILSVSAFLGLPSDTPEDVAVGLLKGFRDLVQSLKSDIYGGHTIQSPWPLIGGTASAILSNHAIITKRGVKVGDRLLLTKPLGLHPVMAADRVLKDDPNWLEAFDPQEVLKSVEMATRMMTTSNALIPRVIHKYNLIPQIHAMTDVTGFGFTHHLQEMLEGSNLGAKIRQIPVIPLSPQLDDLFCYGLCDGKSAEIAGPALLSIEGKSFKDITKIFSQEHIWWREVGVISDQIIGVKFQDDFHMQEVPKYP